MDDIFGALLTAFAGAVVCMVGYVNFGDGWKRLHRSRKWPRTSARVTRAWKVDTSGAPGTTRYNVNYTFIAPERGGSYYGHSESGSRDMKTGDDVAVMYDPSGPYDNDLPANRFEMWFAPTAFGILIVFGAALSILGLGAVIVMIIT